MVKPEATDMTWEDAIAAVLREKGSGLRYTEITDRIAERGLKKKIGATPAASVRAILSLSVKDPNSPFQRVGRGEYVLKESLVAIEKEQVEEVDTDETSVEAEAGALKAFGMFWQRAYVVWEGKSRLHGKQQAGASEVNFADQVGVYLLHDRDRVIYVGRAAESLFVRLKAHTTDRLSGRWDRFSWFGLRNVEDDGSLSEVLNSWAPKDVLDTFEALLIECLEPPLNRKRGDSFTAIEYIQVVDPDIAKKNKKQLLDEIARNMGL